MAKYFRLSCWTVLATILHTAETSGNYGRFRDQQR